MQNLVLGALLDLTEDARAVPHVVTWRGTGQKTAVSLLIELWRAEEQAMGVKRDRNHVMTGKSYLQDKILSPYVTQVVLHKLCRIWHWQL